MREGRGGLVVTIFDFKSDDLSSYSADYFLIFYYKKTKINEKMTRMGHVRSTKYFLFSLTSL